VWALASQLLVCGSCEEHPDNIGISNIR
jgi:hypothetical protein